MKNKEFGFVKNCFNVFLGFELTENYVQDVEDKLGDIFCKIFTEMKVNFDGLSIEYFELGEEYKFNGNIIIDCEIDKNEIYFEFQSLYSEQKETIIYKNGEYKILLFFKLIQNSNNKNKIEDKILEQLVTKFPLK